MSYVTSTNGVNFIKTLEGFESTAYKDQGGVWTIGYGHTAGVYSGMTITESQAENYLKSDLKIAENAVNNKVTIYIPQYRFDALVSLVFNVGASAFANSKLLQKLNQGNINEAATEFDDWNLVDGVPSPGLTNRRAAEKNLFLTGVYDTTVSSGTSTNTSSTISAIQSTMNNRYSTGLAVDGIYGANTKRAMIKGLQTELNKQYNKGLTVDGYWGPKTKDACPIISGGSGNIQYIIQAGLYCIAGFTSLSVDGVYGTNTINAVRSFQEQKNLNPVDGRTGPATFAALFG